MDIQSALAAIDAAVDKSDKQQGIDDVTLDALRFLWTLDPRPADLRATIDWFRNSLVHSDNYIGRYQNANASRNRMRWLIGLPTK